MKTDESTSDIDLEKLKLGEPKEFEKIYHEYVYRVYSYALKVLEHHEDAEEIVQEVFGAIWQHRKSIRSEGFIWTLAKHKCIDRSRKKTIPILSCEELEAIAKKTPENIDEEECQKLLQQLAPGEQQVLSLLLEGRTRKEMVQILDLPMGTIDSRLSRLKKRLKGEKYYGN